MKACECADGGAAAVDVIDLSAEMLHACAEAAAARADGGAVIRCHEGDATEPGLLDGLPGLRAPYDLVIAGWIFDHAHDRAELEAMWRNAVAHLKPGGRLICVRSGDPYVPALLEGRYGIRVRVFPSRHSPSPSRAYGAPTCSTTLPTPHRHLYPSCAVRADGNT